MCGDMCLGSMQVLCTFCKVLVTVHLDCQLDRIWDEPRGLPWDGCVTAFAGRI